MDTLDEIQGVLDDLLTYRGCDSCKHEESGLDTVMRFDDIDRARLIELRC